jgi:23S rRNA pseudouridine2605 synthase
LTSLRLNKYLADSGIASRRAADELIDRGAVTVNGRRARLGDSVEPSIDEIRVDGKLVRAPRGSHITIALNKPIGVVTTLRDERGRPCVGDLLRTARLKNALPKSARRLFPIGRLDAQTTGLLLCTSDGDLARKLAHPSSGVERRYRIEVAGTPSADALRKLRAQEVRRSPRGTRFEMALTSGANREIRRACAQEGLRVVSLERTQFGPISLAGLRQGSIRALSEREMQQLKRAVGDLS